jgi:hypothetical protein
MRTMSLGVVLVSVCFLIFLILGVNVGSVNANWYYGNPMSSSADEHTENEVMVTMKGTITKIEDMYQMKDHVQMLFVAEEGGTWTVYLGPKGFIENQKAKFAAGDNIEVRGKKYGAVIIASEISKGELTLKLRNENDGRAVW